MSSHMVLWVWCGGFWRFVARWDHQACPPQCWVYRQAVTGPDTHTHTNTRTSVWERSGVKQTQMRLLLQVFRQVLLHHLQKERSQYLTMTETVNGYTSAPWTEKNCSLQRSIQLKHILEHAQKNLKHSEGNIRWDRLWGHISSPRLPLCWSETVEEEHNNKL